MKGTQEARDFLSKWGGQSLIKPLTDLLGSEEAARKFLSDHGGKSMIEPLQKAIDAKKPASPPVSKPIADVEKKIEKVKTVIEELVYSESIKADKKEEDDQKKEPEKKKDSLLKDNILTLFFLKNKNNDPSDDL